MGRSLCRSSRSDVPPAEDGDAGFGLLEAIISLAVAAMVLAAATELAGHTLIAWSRGFGRMTAIERTDMALDRMGADLAALLPVAPATANDPATYFVGDARGFAFTAVTAIDRTRDGIATIEIGIEATQRGAALTRRLRLGRDAGLRDGDRTILIDGKVDLGFSYRDRTGKRLDQWTRAGEVPAGVIVTLRAGREGGGLPVEVLLPTALSVPLYCLVQPPTDDQTATQNAPPTGDDGGATQQPPNPAQPGEAPQPNAQAQASEQEHQRRCPVAQAASTKAGGDSGGGANTGGGS